MQTMGSVREAVTDRPERVPMLRRIDAFRKRHPEIHISFPPGSNMWLVKEPGEPDRLYPFPASMMTDLETKYPEDPPA